MRPRAAAGRNPVEAVRRPARPVESATASLTRHQLTDRLAAAEQRGGDWWAAGMLLGLNGLRCGELIACDVTDAGSHSWRRRGGHRWAQRRPLLRNAAGRRMTAYNVQYPVIALMGRRHHEAPHGLRHSAITVGLDAGVSLRDMQGFARHADTKTTRRYDRSRHALNRHATYAIAHYLAGGA